MLIQYHEVGFEPSDITQKSIAGVTGPKVAVSNSAAWYWLITAGNWTEPSWYDMIHKQHQEKFLRYWKWQHGCVYVCAFFNI